MASDDGLLTGLGSASPLGWWVGEAGELSRGSGVINDAIESVNQAVVLVADTSGLAVATGGEMRSNPGNPGDPGVNTLGNNGDLAVAGFCGPLNLGQLGDAGFRADHQLKYAYMCGAMANGIASARLVEAAAKSGMLGSYGAAGQTIEMIVEALDYLDANLNGETYAVNLIHSPNEPAHEAAVVDLLIERGVKLIEASAYLGLTLDVVRYRVHGIYRDEAGVVVAPNRVIAKASRVEVATRWFSPPPVKMLAELVAQGHITEAQAELAGEIPMAQDLTAEADSGGHTDNRAALALLPTILALAARLSGEFGYAKPLRVGLGGGIATPASAAGALAMGAGYLVTGTVNQSCVESGSSDAVRVMLAEAGQADVTMAPAADMFEMGVKLQVLKRGTMFAMRAQKLFELYRAYDSIEAIPAAERLKIEKTIFRANLDEVWDLTRDYFGRYDPAQITKAEGDDKHKMALIFRWYLGLSSRWANSGEADRRMDYQVWCGPAMGAFNEWVAGSFLEGPQQRGVVVVGLNILWGAAVVLRAGMLGMAGAGMEVRPRTIEQLQDFLELPEGARA